MKGIRMVVTYKCNFMCSNCKYSCAPYKKGSMDVQRFKNEVYSAIDEGYKDYIIIDGGESFLKEGLAFKYLKSIYDVKIKKSIVTNGYWGKKDMFIYTLEGLKNYKVDEIIIKYDYFHSYFIDINTIKQSILRSIKMDFKVAVLSTFETENINTSKDIYTYNFIKDLKKNFRNIEFIFQSIKDYQSFSLCHRVILKNEKVIFFH